MKSFPVGVVAVVLVALTAHAHAEAPPRIQDAIAHAAMLGRPVIVEFSATWCAPCRVFERDVLDDPRVKRALADVELVRYDIDTELGQAAAQRFAVTGVPTLLVIELDGRESVRNVGLGADVAWFLKVIASASVPRATLAELNAAIVRDPTNVAPRLALARHHRATGNLADASVAYQAIVDLPNVDVLVAADAADVLAELRLADTRMQLTVDAAVEFATRFPESPLATDRLALAFVSERVPRVVLEELIGAHVAAVIPRGRRDAIRLAVLAGFPVGAERGIAALRAIRPTSLVAQLLALEHALYAGRATAASLDAVCAAPQLEAELACYMLRAARGGRHPVPAIKRLRDRATSVALDLADPGTRSTSTETFGFAALTGDDDQPFGDALARVLRLAEQQCKALATRTAYVQLALAEGAGRPVAVKFHDASAELEACLRPAVESARLPPPPAHLGRMFYAPLVRPAAVQRVERRGRPYRPPPHARATFPPTPPFPSGGLGFAFDRGGAVESIGVGSHGVLDLGALLDLRVMTTWQVETGIASGGHASYRARGLVGLGAGPGGGAMVAALVGTGVVRLGDSPREPEIPVELRMRFPVGNGAVRAHAWLQIAWIRGAPDAMDRWRDARIGDELSFGLGASVAVSGGTRIFFGGVIENREAGTSALVLAGIPLGGFF